MRTRIFVFFLLFAAVGAYVNADVPYDSYLYNRWLEPIEAPHSYVPDAMFRGEDLGITSFSSPSGLFVNKANGDIYIADTGNNRVVRLSRDWKVENVYEGFNEPSDVFVTEDDRIFVADTENHRVAILNVEGDLIQEFGTPESDLISENFIYFPQKVVVDKAGRIYVVARGVNEGLLELSKDGIFKQFFGAIKVDVNPIDYAWKMISTQAQRKTMRRTVPTVYNNIAIDDKGFLFGTISAYNRWQILDAIYSFDEQVTPIRKLNPGGEDILKRDDWFPPVGDVRFVSKESTIPGPSAFGDIVIDETGIYHVLDMKRGRVFSYDPDGKMISIFGGLGNRLGLLKNPVAIELLGEDILVLDSKNAAVNVYKPTKYGSGVHAAIDDYFNGKYDESEANWKNSLDQNANLEWAYVGIGNARYRQDRFEEAMDYFEIIRRPGPFSKAFRYYRKEVAERYFGWIVAAVAVVWIGYRLLRRRIRNRAKGLQEA